jgi:glycosyltransferase involved in cell wall biosynthesis
VLSSPEQARAWGAAARRRVVARYSWAGHCAALEQVLEEMQQI